jgi:uncharacterized protein (TIGR01440 family)
MAENLRECAAKIARELVEAARLAEGNTVVVGCSTSEVIGERIGSHSVPTVADEILDGLLSVFSPKGIHLAAQCCEHLNRALIVERAAFPNAEAVNVVPQPKAGGSFATAAYRRFSEPIALEHIRADAGLDIGGTLIGMHLKEVAVPLRLSVASLGAAPITAARVRPKFIGGSRAVYDEKLL